MSTDRQKLVTLRLSVARIAQALGLEHEIPDYDENADMLQLPRVQERGWNQLCASIIDKIEERRT